MHPLNLKPAFLALLAATAFSPWMVGAFDWPEKPTAEVKADLIAYAKSVGRAEFAAAIESQQDATSWMKAALEFGTARLKECEGADFRDLNRQIALRIIDYPLHVNNADMTMPGEERMAWCEAVRDYLVSRGVPTRLIGVLGYGEAQPLVETADGVVEPQNRYAMILFR